MCTLCNTARIVVNRAVHGGGCNAAAPRLRNVLICPPDPAHQTPCSGTCSVRPTESSGTARGGSLGASLLISYYSSRGQARVSPMTLVAVAKMRASRFQHGGDRQYGKRVWGEMSAGRDVAIGAGTAAAAPADGGTTVPFTRIFRRCDYSRYVGEGPVGSATGFAVIQTPASNKVAATVHIEAAQSDTQYEVRLIQAPRPASVPSSAGDPATTVDALMTDAVGTANATLQHDRLAGATGAWVLIERPEAHRRRIRIVDVDVDVDVGESLSALFPGRGAATHQMEFCLVPL